MASDGSQSLLVTSARPGEAPRQPAAPPRGATGVWDGPAPTGWRTAAPSPEPAFDAAKEPRSLILPGGLSLPLLLVAAGDAAGVAAAVSAGALLVQPGCEAAVGATLRAGPHAKLFVAATLPGAPQDAGACAPRWRPRGAAFSDSLQPARAP